MDYTAGWCGMLQPDSGIGEDARRLINVLSHRGVKIAVEQPENATWADTLNLDFRHVVPRPASCEYRIVQGFPDPEWWDNPASTFDGAKVVWRMTFETNQLPIEWRRKANSAHAIWVPSHFNAQTFVLSGIEPERVRHLPPPIDFEFTGAAEHAAAVKSTGRRFRFLSILSWQLRKGWDVLLRAYFSEFSSNDDVELIIKVTPFRGNIHQVRRDIGDLIESVKSRKKGRLPPLHLAVRMLTRAEISTLYGSADAFVLATRGEGWCFPLFDAMSVGLPTIGTGWGGQTDYMSNETAYPIDYNMVPVSDEAATEWPLFSGHSWAEPSVEHLRTLMREVSSGNETVHNRAIAGRRHVRAIYSPESAFSRLAPLLGVTDAKGFPKAELSNCSDDCQ